jgi:hypothetical protein
MILQEIPMQLALFMTPKIRFVGISFCISSKDNALAHTAPNTAMGFNNRPFELGEGG